MTSIPRCAFASRPHRNKGRDNRPVGGMGTAATVLGMARVVAPYSTPNANSRSYWQTHRNPTDQWLGCPRSWRSSRNTHSCRSSCRLGRPRCTRARYRTSRCSLRRGGNRATMRGAGASSIAAVEEAGVGRARAARRRNRQRVGEVNRSQLSRRPELGEHALQRRRRQRVGEVRSLDV